MIPGAVIVLFNPSEQHISNLVSLTMQCEHIVAVDNSLRPESRLYTRLATANIQTLSNFNRGGVAGAYNRGVELLTARGVNLFFFFDQDSHVPADYFSAMTARCKGIPGARFLVGPKILDINVNRYLPAHTVSRFGLRAIEHEEADRGLLPCSSLISSGSALSADAYHALGPFREDLVIDHVDTEYCFRAACHEIPIYINTGVTLAHQLSKRVDHKWTFLTLTEWNMAPLRQYYAARNCLCICRRYGLRFPVLVLINVITVQQIISVLFFERDKRTKLLAMFAGIFDGLRNRTGSVENRWPALVAAAQGGTP